MKSARLALVALVALVTAVAVCACAAPTTTGTADATPRATLPVPAGVVDPARPAPADTGGSAPACDPTASSFAPTGPLPKPGQMPPGSPMAGVYARGVLRVGVDQNTYNWGYRDPATGQIVGFDIDIARAVAHAIFGRDNAIQFVAITAAQRIPYLQDGKVDLVADTMTITCDRLRQVLFSSVYYEAGQQVLVPRTSAVRGIGDLGGRRVCAAAGSTSIANIAAPPPKLAPPAPMIPVAVADWTDCLVLLQQGQVDAISTDNAILAGMVAQDPNTKIVGPAFTDEPYGLAMSKGSQRFVEFVNAVLAEMRVDGEWAAIYHRWLPGRVPQPPVARYRD
jgi:polar amino acid transport system substrate-binding protein